MIRRPRQKLGAALALLSITSASGGCYAGYGGYTGYGGQCRDYDRGYGGYGRASTSSGCFYGVSGGAEEALALAILFGGVLVVAGIVELVEWVADIDRG